MSVRARFSLDTGILIHAVDRDAGERHDQARDLVGRAAKRDCVLTIQALAGFFQAAIGGNRLAPVQARAFVDDWLHLFDVVGADMLAFQDAMDAVEEHRLPFRDAMLWAVARRAGCTAILSGEMQDGRRLNGVFIINPFAAGSEERLATLVGI